MVIIHFDAGHTRNGNPRRCYALFHPGERAGYGSIGRVWDEGYAGVTVVTENFRGYIVPGRVATTPAQYREFLKLYA